MKVALEERTQQLIAAQNKMEDYREHAERQEELVVCFNYSILDVFRPNWKMILLYRECRRSRLLR